MRILNGMRPRARRTQSLRRLRAVLVVALLSVGFAPSVARAARQIAAGPGGSIVAITYEHGPEVVRLSKDGHLDKAFGNHGVARPSALRKKYVTGLFVDRGGAIDLALERYPPCGDPRGCPFSAYVLRLRPDGTVERRFGNDGLALAFKGVDGAAGELTRSPMGDLLVSGYTCHFETSICSHDVGLLGALSVNGSRDPAFGTNGVSRISSSSNARFQVITIDSAGRILVGGTFGPTDATLARLLPDGAPDLGFGGGVVQIPRPFNDIYPNLDGTITLGGALGHVFAAEQLLSDGSPDPSFGTDGVTRVRVGKAEFGSGDLLIGPGGEATIAGRADLDCANHRLPHSLLPCYPDFGLLRLTDAGQPDPTFGVNGLETNRVNHRRDGDRSMSVDAVSSGGRMIESGATSSADLAQSAVIALHDDGTLVRGFGQGGVVYLPPR